MKQNILLALLCALVCLCHVSCSDDTADDVVVVLSSDCYISNLYINNVKREWHHTDRNGQDSVTYTSLTAAGYAFRIDNIHNTIYNPEALPSNSILHGVTLTITASSTVMYRPVDADLNDTWTAYSSTDTMDVSRPLTLRAYSTDGHWRDYTLTVNRAKADADSLGWTHLGDCPALAAYVRQRAYMDADGRLTVVGVDATGIVSRVRPLEDGAQAESCAWYDPVPDEVRSLIDAGRLDAPADSLPAAQTMTGAVLTKASGITRYLMVGLRDTADSLAVVWGCRAGAQRLMFYEHNNSLQYALPALNDLHVVAHDGRFVALGGESLHRNQKIEALERIYITRDYGVTWHSGTGWTAPDELRGRTAPLAITTDGDTVYVVSGTQVWTMKSNSLD